MRQSVIIFILVFIISGCKKATISTGDVLKDLVITPSGVDADGSSLVNISVNLTNNADASDRKIVFTTTRGTFVTTGNNTVTVDPQYENRQLIARASLNSPLSPGFIVISAQPDTRSQYRDFVVKDSVLATASLPVTIVLTPSAFGISTGFAGEVQVTGVLKNNKGKNVSLGNKVNFSAYLKNGLPLNGRFRAIQSSSDANSEVKAIYSPGFMSVGTDFYIKVNLIDSLGNLSTIKDSVLLSVTE